MGKFKVVLLVSLLVLSSVLFAIVPGMDKSVYGGSVYIWPIGIFYTGVNLFYEEGVQLYYYEPYKLYVDGYFGPSIDVGYGSYLSVSGVYTTLKVHGNIYLYTDKFSFELFGMKLYPGLKFGMYVYWDMVGVSYEESRFTGGSIGLGYNYPTLVLLTSIPEKGKSSMNWYIWPLPIIVGVTFWNYY